MKEYDPTLTAEELKALHTGQPCPVWDTNRELFEVGFTNAVLDLPAGRYHIKVMEELDYDEPLPANIIGWVRPTPRTWVDIVLVREGE